MVATINKLGLKLVERLLISFSYEEYKQHSCKTVDVDLF